MLCKKIEISLFGVCIISGILAAVYCLVAARARWARQLLGKEMV